MLINRKVEHLGAVGIRVPSNVWTETIRFYADILGLQIEDKSESCILMRAKRDRKAYTLALYRSDRPGLQNLPPRRPRRLPGNRIRPE